MTQPMAKKEIALIFSGGGARGAFEYGVWKALKELGTTSQITGIAGTSIGALNTLFYIQKDFYKAGDIWLSLSTGNIVRINRSFLSLLFQLIRTYPSAIHHLPDLRKIIPYLKSFTGFLDNETLYDILNRSINMVKIASNTLDTYVCCTRLPKTKDESLIPVYFDLKNQFYTKEELIHIFMASSAIYPFFDKIEINGSYYIDGGFTDNTPITPLYEAGYRKFIVVYLNHKNPDTSLLYAKCFPGAVFTDIRPDPSIPTGRETTLNFNQDFITALMEDGYVQTMKLEKEIAAL